MKLKKTKDVKKEILAEQPQEEKKGEKTLRDIMDTSRPFTMLYSGVEDDRNFNLLYDMGIRNFLISYHYVQKKHLDVSKYEELGIKFFVDSGAFTYMNSLDTSDSTLEDWEKHIQRYLAWVKKHKSIIFAIASLDIEYLVGGEVVQQWNEKYFEPFMLETGIPVCFVYHDNASLLTWEQYCQRYPYVGISWGNVDTPEGPLNYGLKKLKVAEKYGSLVHGMAMTKTALLTKLPFYTSDSTTWLIGLQYGEISFWNGTKMNRLKKDRWKGSFLKLIVAKGFDEQKLLNEDTVELIKVNVHAFIESEEYVREKLKSRMYWLKPDKLERTAEDIENIEYPSEEWLRTEMEDWEDQAKLFNVSIEEDPNFVKAILQDITCIMNWDNGKYKSLQDEIYTEEIIDEIHTTWVNRITYDKDEKIADIQKFFTECLCGENDKLLMLGTNFDRIVKEREEYISDEEYDEVEVSPLELNNKLSVYLPPPLDESEVAPEITDLDDEIFRDNGIEPVRDKNGRFVKGQTKVLKPKKIYSDKFPKLACDTCFVAQKCPEYKAGFACAYNKIFNKFDTRDMGDIIQAMQGIVGFSLSRLQRSMMFEVMEGGMVDANVSNLINQNMTLLNNLKNMYECGNREVLRQTKVIKSDGTQEMTTQVTNPQSGGVLERIFGNFSTETEEEIEPQPPKDVTEEEENS